MRVKIIHERRKDKLGVIFQLQDYRQQVSESYNASGPKISALQQALDFRLEHIASEQELLQRECRIQTVFKDLLSKKQRNVPA